jgi:hypothetical protein
MAIGAAAQRSNQQNESRLGRNGFCRAEKPAAGRKKGLDAMSSPWNRSIS